jgi:hypothetical protein
MPWYSYVFLAAILALAAAPAFHVLTWFVLPPSFITPQAERKMRNSAVMLVALFVALLGLYVWEVMR